MNVKPDIEAAETPLFSTAASDVEG